MTEVRPAHRQIGRRVKAAREALGWTQDQLAAEMEFKDRQTISDIEQGKRATSPDELVTLSRALGHDVEYFLDPFQVAGEAAFSWRAERAVSAKQLCHFEEIAGSWIGLYRWIRSIDQSPPSALKKALRLSKYSSFRDAQLQAERLVLEMGWGHAPSEDLENRIERQLGIPVLNVDPKPFPGENSLSGAACQLDDLTIILINRRENVGRKNFDLAHELFHALTWDAIPPERLESSKDALVTGPKRVEQLANNFAAALLMPEASLKELGAQSAVGDISALLEIARFFRVTPVALGWRLVNLGWGDAALCKKLRSKPLNIPERHKPTRLFSEPFVGGLHKAIASGKISFRKAASAIGLSRDEIIQLFADYGLSSPLEEPT